MSDVCGFCHGRPVTNAAHWHDAGAPQYAACPRCGERHADDEPSVTIHVNGEPRTITLRPRRAGVNVDMQRRMIELYTRGKSIREVAREVFVDTSTVWLILRTYGVPMHPHGGSKSTLTTEQLLEVGELYARGLTQQEIADRLGLKSASSVRRRLDRLGGYRRTASEASLLGKARKRQKSERT